MALLVRPWGNHSVKPKWTRRKSARTAMWIRHLFRLQINVLRWRVSKHVIKYIWIPSFIVFDNWFDLNPRSGTLEYAPTVRPSKRKASSSNAYWYYCLDFGRYRSLCFFHTSTIGSLFLLHPLSSSADDTGLASVASQDSASSIQSCLPKCLPKFGKWSWRLFTSSQHPFPSRR